jgi:hypothetical protein
MKENCFCKNCNTELQGNYCHTCGQKASVGRLTTHTVLHNMFHGIFHCDRSILYTYYALFTCPGKVIADYIAGRRIRYFNPFTMFIISAGISTVLTEIVLAAPMHASLPAASDTIQLRFWHHLQAITSNLVFIELIFILPLIFAAKLVIGKKSGNHYNYMELLVAGVYIDCQRIAVYILVGIPWILIVGTGSPLISYYKLLYAIILLWDIKQLFGLSVKSAIRRTSLIILCMFTIISGIAIILTRIMP